MKKKLLSMLVLLMTAVTGAWADDYTITLPTVSNGSVVAKVSDVSVTSAAAGATVTLEATPDAGYKLKTISGTYQGAPEETLSGSNHPATLSGTYFTLNSSARVNARWNLYNSTITITSKDAGIKIDRVEFNLNWKGSSFDASLLSADHGTLSVSGNTLTVTSINNSSVTITSTANSAHGCGTDRVTIYGTGTTVDKTLTLTSTGDANVKTFTMPSSNVTVSAEFELAPINLTANEGATNEYWATFFSNASNYQASAGTKVFAVNLTGTAIEMTEITDGIVNSGQGVVLKSTAASITMTPNASASAGDYSTNSLTGTMTSITNPGNAYVLNYKAATGAGFYKLGASGTIGANKAYLTYSSGGAPEFFSFSGETTGIDATLVNSEKVNSVVYDLQGRRVSQPAKGLYIVNGKKVIIK